MLRPRTAVFFEQVPPCHQCKKCGAAQAQKPRDRALLKKIYCVCIACAVCGIGMMITPWTLAAEGQLSESSRPPPTHTHTRLEGSGCRWVRERADQPAFTGSLFELWSAPQGASSCYAAFTRATRIPSKLMCFILVGLPSQPIPYVNGFPPVVTPVSEGKDRGASRGYWTAPTGLHPKPR